MANIRDGMSIYGAYYTQHMLRLHCKNQVFGLFKTTGNLDAKRREGKIRKQKTPPKRGSKLVGE
ncbi:MAG: hypothetical protein RSG80_10075, partial [Citrobacter sp.]